MGDGKKSKRGQGDRLVQICTAIRRAILDRALRPGDRLPEDTLGERFGASRTIARHALGQLAAEGLVDLRRNRMAVVAVPSLDEARDIFDLRVVLERQVVLNLTGRLTDQQVRQLQALVDAEHKARHGEDGMSIRLATEFHVKLAEMTGKSILIRYVTEICYRAGLALSAFGRPHSSDCAVSEHLDLIEAIRTGPPEKAADLMEAHLEAVAGRALLHTADARNRDLMEILAPYSEPD